MAERIAHSAYTSSSGTDAFSLSYVWGQRTVHMGLAFLGFKRLWCFGWIARVDETLRSDTRKGAEFTNWVESDIPQNWAVFLVFAFGTGSL